MHLMSRVALLAAFALGAATAEAAVVSGTYAPVTGNRWLLSLTVGNDGAPATIPGFSVYFDQTLFSGLSVEASPPGWDTLVLQPDPGLASPGLFDSLADPGAELPSGATLGGFAVAFDDLGGGLPASLPYEIYRLDGNGVPVVLASGQVAIAPAALPEPGSLLLTLAALGALPALRRRRAPSARSGASVQSPIEVSA